ncbi:hypothetical protein [Hymenobacter antarcticus]|uniref:Erythromycin esterase homolog n=1 Tax=Hymenobacter antarcticus TaxID=486270 RepID=A0ABP7PWY2_9BACT
MRDWIPAVIACLMGLANPGTASAQRNPFRLAEQLMLDHKGNLDYVAPLRGLAAADKTTFDSDMYSQALETYNSFVGKLTPTVPIRSATPYGLVEVGPLLAARARTTSVILINEAHNQPAHRAYCRQLLRQLAPLGYTIFAVEALSPSDTAINERKFPLATSGFYIREPNMGNLLRTACASGFHVFSHEVSRAQNKEFSDWRRSSNYRDSMQAVNILARLRKNPKAKIVALVGYDHVLEKERDGVKRLATYLRELGHLDPFTIDQTLAYLPSHGTPATKPMALVTAKGHLATIGERQGYVDMQVIHPAVRLVQGRPDWLAATAATKPITAPIPAPYADRRCLAQLYDQKEFQQYGTKAVPLDQYLTDGHQQRVRLWGLKPGRPVLIKYRPTELK